MLKIIGGIIIVLATTIIGFAYAGIFVERVRQLRGMQYALNVLEAEIIYTSTPLIEALQHVSERSSDAIKKLFDILAQLLMEKRLTSVVEAFEEASQAIKGDLYFEKEEMDVITSFMQSLGNTDAEGQKKNFNITIKKLEAFEQKAEENRKKNEKLFRYLGVCCGMLIVIILI